MDSLLCGLRVIIDLQESNHKKIYGNDNPEVSRLLIKYGANVKAIDNDGWTPLHRAAYCNDPEASRLLIENENANSYRTALWCGLIGIVSMKSDWLGLMPGIAK